MKIPILLLALCVTFPLRLQAQNYTAEKNIRPRCRYRAPRRSSASGVEVSIAPSVGNRLYEMKVHGKNVLNSSAPDGIADFQKRLESGGIPFLAPWANRLGEQDFWANGKKYIFNMTLGNVAGGPVPIHGLLATSPSLGGTEVKADKRSAHITSRLQFWRYPDLMAQWPFAQEYEMTYELSKGALETRLVVTNLSADPMPIVLGFHPCFRIRGGRPRRVDRRRLPPAKGPSRTIASSPLANSYLSPAESFSGKGTKAWIRASRISNAMPPALRIFPLNQAGRKWRKSSVRSTQLPLFIRRPAGKRCASNR